MIKSIIPPTSDCNNSCVEWVHILDVGADYLGDIQIIGPLNLRHIRNIEPTKNDALYKLIRRSLLEIVFERHGNGIVIR